jgi:TBC1 domain family protein 5
VTSLTESTTADAPAQEKHQPQLAVPSSIAKRPAPIPTRSTLAQSSFSWMLEPDEPQVPKSPPSVANKGSAQHKKRGMNASREKNAFLFGDVAETEGNDPFGTDDIFGLQPMVKSKAKE